MKSQNTGLLFLLILLLSVLAACTPVEGVLDIYIKPAAHAADESAPSSVRQVALSFLEQYDWRDYIQFLTTPCTKADGLGGPPKCDEGMADGTPVKVFPLGGPEGHFATPETIDTMLEFWIKNLYAVYRVSADAYKEPYWPAGEYALLFERDQNGVPFPVTVLVENGKIVRVDFHYGVTAAEQLQSVAVEQVIVPPMEVEAWLYQNGK